MKVEQILPDIYRCWGESQYDLAMHFLRYNEYQECPNDQFRGKTFLLVDYMDWYVKDRNQSSFTYALDWLGFNIPSQIVIQARIGVEDYNKYDRRMYEIVSEIYANTGKYGYLIGIQNEDDLETLDHEIAHGLYYTCSEYKNKADKLIRGLSPIQYDHMEDCLIEKGYSDNVIDDEIQAFMATGLYDEMKVGMTEEVVKPFEELFRLFRYTK